MDISLVETEKLIEELMNRHDAIVLATLKIEEGGEPTMYSYWSLNKYLECAGLCSTLDRDIKDSYTCTRKIDFEKDE